MAFVLKPEVSHTDLKLGNFTQIRKRKHKKEIQQKSHSFIYTALPITHRAWNLTVFCLKTWEESCKKYVWFTSILNVIIFSVYFNLNAVLKWYNRGSLGGKTLHRYHYLYTTLVLQTPDSAVGFHGRAGWVKNVVCLAWLMLFIRSSRLCWWCEIISSSVQKIWESDKDRGHYIKHAGFKCIQLFFRFFRKALFSPLHSSFLLFQGHILGAPPGSEWECCRPFSRRAQRGCKAAGCSGLNCTEWEKRRPARKNKYKNTGNLDQFQRMTRKCKNIFWKTKMHVFFN